MGVCKLIAYGKARTGCCPIHGDSCRLSFPIDICKKRERKTAKEDIAAELEHIGSVHEKESVVGY